MVFAFTVSEAALLVEIPANVPPTPVLKLPVKILLLTLVTAVVLPELTSINVIADVPPSVLLVMVLELILRLGAVPMVLIPLKTFEAPVPGAVLLLMMLPVILSVPATALLRIPFKVPLVAVEVLFWIVLLVIAKVLRPSAVPVKEASMAVTVVPVPETVIVLLLMVAFVGEVGFAEPCRIPLSRPA